MRYLAFVLVALLGVVGSPSAAIASVVTSPKRTVVLSGDSVGSVRFGESQQKAVSALKKLIGATDGGVQNAEGNCTIDAALYWTNFSVYLLMGRFVGYQTGNNLTDKREPTFNGKTPQELRIGDTLAEARKLYPGHVTTRGENGGVYAIKTTTGTIRGYLSLETSSPPNEIKIVSISAGSVGCPAASPG
ncbi:MAG: hypothetical protein ABSC00_01260 [Acidimicrobiales bacterium]|jgi:hypothetical protein